ncbi:hypothetical protein [Photobacterium atrarenae]|uniref:Uncharacterized protein n=1 Tax=Photobacterium atrarenae TaxID=865757 RepID=A0ABY5GMC7_9GAMM|nr:hypothetical protein [Photobacterium atrarenae]UTV30472.1 hypothetical protein NNL38_18015 [Photobacterium atrarenae]
MRKTIHLTLSLIFTTGALALSTAVLAEQTAQDTQTAAYQPLPGERNCLFRYGPVSADPYINVAYPDAGVQYWGAAFTVPEGASLYLEGQFPHSRYMSLISYDEYGRPIQSLADYLIEPTPGHTNPFREGAKRNSNQRDYQVRITNTPPDNDYTKGIKRTNQTDNLLHAPRSPANQQVMIYRIYAEDKGHGVTAGVSLPIPVVKTAQGDTLKGKAACDYIQAEQPLRAKLSALGVSVGQYRALINQPDKPDTHPATNPSTWHIQLDRESLLGIYTGNINPNSRRSEGGFYPNLDNNYIRTVINRKHGPVYVLRAKAPTTPKTYQGDLTMGSGQLRYWSVCSNKSLAVTKVNDCLYDEHIPVDNNGYYTIAISRAADRPRNAYAQCGVGWLPMADDGDGLFDQDASIVQIRHMLADANFSQAIQQIEFDKDIANVMGEFYPNTFYTTTNNFELMFPCPLEG